MEDHICPYNSDPEDEVIGERRMSCKDCPEIRALHIMLNERMDSYDDRQEMFDKNNRFRTWAVGLIVSALLTANLFLLGSITKKISAIEASNRVYQQFMFENVDIDSKLNWMIIQQQRLFHGLNKVEEKNKIDKTPYPDYLGNVL